MDNANTQVLSWGERFALINHFKPSDEAICQAFSVHIEELETARSLLQNGMLTTAEIDPTAYVGLFESTVEVKPTKEAPAVIPSSSPPEGTTPVPKKLAKAVKEQVQAVPAVVPAAESIEDGSGSVKGKRGRPAGESRAVIERIFLDNYQTAYRSQIVELVRKQLGIASTNTASVYVHNCEKRLDLVAKRGRAPKE